MKPYTATDAEADLRTAIDEGDRDTIGRAEKAVETLTAETAATSPSLLGAALWYAEQGVAVFPLSPGSKIPLPRSRGFKDATTDADTIRAWWVATPDANIGLATGGTFDVVDVDGHEGQRSRAKLWAEVFAQIDADAVGKVLTPRPGGMHIYVPATGAANAANIAPCVDYRGLGGYVVAPPSRTDVGTYRWLGQPRLDLLTRKAA